MASATSAKTEPKDSLTSREASSVPGLILAAVLRHNKEDALNYRSDGEWHNITAPDFVERVKNVALGLAALGIRPGDRVALLSENRPEWSIADLAILSLGAINVPIYTTQALEQVDYILSDSGARAIFIATRRLYKHVQPVFAKRPLERLIFFESEVAEDVEHAIGLEQLEQHGTRAGSATSRCLRRLPASRAARRPGHDHLHLRHHWRTQRRDADAQQLHVKRAVDREGLADHSH